jgi:mRNA interferase RelE/StbE
MLHPQLKRKLRAALDDLARDASLGKPLKDPLAGYRSLRIGKFRLVYRVAANRHLELLDFGPRETIYEESRRLVGRGK